MLVATPENMWLAKKLSEKTGVRIGDLETKRFPDGDFYARMNTKDLGSRIIIVHSLYPEQDRKIWELSYIADICDHYGVQKTDITAIVPYLPSRQDKIFERGEISAVDLLFKTLKASGLNGILTVDSHFDRKGERRMYIPHHSISAARELYNHAIENFDLDDPLLFSPDGGHENAVKALGGQALKKKRVGSRKVEYDKKKIPDVKGRDVLFIDDMYSSCTTMMTAIKNVKRKGAENIGTAATHGLFVKDGYKKLEKMTKNIVATNTIPDNPAAKIDIIDLLVKGMEDTGLIFKYRK